MLTELLGYSVLFVFFMAIIIGASKLLDEIFKTDDPWK
jgi:hypothetical protein